MQRRAATKLQSLVRMSIHRTLLVQAFQEQLHSSLACPGTVQGKSGYYEVWQPQTQTVVVARFLVSKEGEWALAEGPYTTPAEKRAAKRASLAVGSAAPAGTQDFIFVRGPMGIGWGGQDRHHTDVDKIVPGAQAAALGVQVGDTLLAINGQLVSQDASIKELMQTVLNAGRPCALRFRRCHQQGRVQAPTTT